MITTLVNRLFQDMQKTGKAVKSIIHGDIREKMLSGVIDQVIVHRYDHESGPILAVKFSGPDGSDYFFGDISYEQAKEMLGKRVNLTTTKPGFMRKGSLSQKLEIEDGKVYSVDNIDPSLYRVVKTHDLLYLEERRDVFMTTHNLGREPYSIPLRYSSPDSFGLLFGVRV